MSIANLFQQRQECKMVSQTHNKRQHFKVFLLFLLFVVLSCQSAQYPAQSFPDITVTEFTTCTDWSEAGHPIGSVDIFPSDTDAISVCGVLTSNIPITLSVNWSYKDDLFFQDVKHDVNDIFQSTIKPQGEFFDEGVYEVRLYIGRSRVRTISFEVTD